MKKLFFLLLLFPLTAFGQSFSDVDKDSPYYDAIEWAVEEGVVHGFSDNTFRPEQEVSRAEFLKLVLLRKYTQEEIDAFQVPQEFLHDVSSGDWFYQYVYFALAHNIIQEYEDHDLLLFLPYNSLSFLEANEIYATLLNNTEGTQYDGEALYAKRFYKNSNFPFSRLRDDILTRELTAEYIFALEHQPIGDGYYSRGDSIVYKGGRVRGPNVDPAPYRTLQGIPSTETGITTETIFYDIYDMVAILKSDNFVFFEDKKIEGADPYTFESLHGPIMKDKNSVYLWGKKLNQVDAESFQTVERATDIWYIFTYFTDKNFVYELSNNKSQVLTLKKLKGVDSASFEVFPVNYYNFPGGGGVSRDKNHYYRDGEIIDWLDIETAKVFYNGEIIEKLEFDSFLNTIVIAGENALFVHEKKIPHTFDFQTLKVLYSGDVYSIFLIIRDKNGLYIQVPQFAFDSPSTPEIEAFYKNPIKITSDVDIPSFKHLGWNYYKDKDTFYYLDSLDAFDGDIFTPLNTHQADVSSLAHVEQEYFRDKTSFYRADEDGVLRAIPFNQRPR